MTPRRPQPAAGASPHVVDGVPPEHLVRALKATSELALITEAKVLDSDGGSRPAVAVDLPLREIRRGA
ncbi:hypothetical protein [Arthrobacter sp. AL12]|uniref:hypothetical protein n=1 Tax=Arthrobacter sp. AL12 TaxID=3042241 RepID=UPI00249C26CD|nr:hypothetical protein [Arthrobacter sp. AL12]MDI3213195.1 hypothetical protein [Arthrobacter sp. AL12]